MNAEHTENETGANPEKEPDYAIALTREDINTLPIDRYEGPVQLIGLEDDPTPACETLARESILGFDTETRPSFRKGEHYLPSLIQLASAELVYLFQIKRSIPLPLKQLLGRTDVLKAGVSLDYDIKQLKALDDFEPGGFVGLEPLAKKLRIKNQGLRGLAAALFGFRISKKAQCSNWSRTQLTEAQITYAATDAWISRRLYVELQRRLSETAGETHEDLSLIKFS